MQASKCSRTPGATGCLITRALGGLQLALAIVDAMGSSLMQFVGKQINEDKPRARRCSLPPACVARPMRVMRSSAMPRLDRGVLTELWKCLVA